MTQLIITESPLSKLEIVTCLHQIRNHSLSDRSGFAVAALLEIVIQNKYFYIGGTNVENEEHHLLSFHAEHSAIAAMQTLLGRQFFSKVWIMGAPKGINAREFVSACGHCRQLLASNAKENADVIAVNVLGEMDQVTRLADLLPNVFTEEALEIKFIEDNAVATFTPNFSPLQLLQLVTPIKQTDIIFYLRNITPYQIESKFNTSPILSCILKTNHGYVPGALWQNIAFLSADAVFSAFSLAISRYGAENLLIEEIYFYGNALHAAQLSGCELRLITRFAQRDIPIHFYQSEEEHCTYLLSQCIEASSQLIASHIKTKCDARLHQ